MSSGLDNEDPLDVCVSIDAAIDRVWQLIREPTLFIDLVAKNPPVIESRTSRLWTVDDVIFGSFLLRQVSSVEGRRAVYRWEPLTADGRPLPGAALVEFWLDDDPAGPVTLHVRERKLGLLPGDEELEEQLETSEWRIALDAARTFLERG